LQSSDYTAVHVRNAGVGVVRLQHYRRSRKPRSKHHSISVVAVGTIRPLRSRWAGEFRLEPDTRRGRQAATAGDRLDQCILIRNSGRGDADIAGARGGKGMTNSAAAPLQVQTGRAKLK